MSSMLRSFEPVPCPCFRVLEELASPELFQDFIVVTTHIFRNCKCIFVISCLDEIQFGEMLDKARQGSNLMI